MNTSGKMDSKATFIFVGIASAATLFFVLIYPAPSPSETRSGVQSPDMAEMGGPPLEAEDGGVRQPPMTTTSDSRGRPEPVLPEAELEAAQASLDAFDVYAGPYGSDFLDRLSLKEVRHCRQLLRDEQAQLRANFLAKAVGVQEPVTHDEFQNLSLEDGESIYLPRFTSGESPVYFQVDPAAFPEIYALRDHAKSVQLSRSFIDHVEGEHSDAIDAALSIEGASNIETRVGVHGDYFRVWGTINGEKRLLVDIATPTWM